MDERRFLRAGDVLAPCASLRGSVPVLVALVLLAGCATAPKFESVSEEEPARRVVGYALSLQGSPFRYGKASPEEGFDCSGFIQHVYRVHGIPLPRTAREMAAALPAVDARERRAGDLLFFNTDGQPYSHVGLYVGDGSFVHAPSSRTGHVMVSSLTQPYWWQRFTGVRRPPLAERHLSSHPTLPLTKPRGLP